MLGAIQRELDRKYGKDAHLVIPFGKRLIFTGEVNGEQVEFGLDGSGNFTISIDGSPAVVFATSGDIDDVNAKLEDSYAFELDLNGRALSFKKLSDGSLGSINFLASEFNVFDGVTDRPLLSAGAGLLTVNGDVAVGGSIFIGAARWPVGLQPKTFYKADGETIQWANGAALSAIPNYQVIVPAGVALASGEAWEAPTITGITTTGGTLRLKISTPGATAGVTDTTDSAGGGGDPDRVMDKADADDAYDGIYSERITGTINITSILDSGVYFHFGDAIFSTWFDDGGGWQEGPSIHVYPLDVFGYETSLSDETGSHAFDVTMPVTWADAIGQHGGKEYGVSYESGGSLTDFVSVAYTKQSTSGTRTGSPNGEKATIIVTPVNV